MSFPVIKFSLRKYAFYRKAPENILEAPPAELLEKSSFFGGWEYLDKNGYSIDRGKYVYNWDDSEYRCEEEKEERVEAEEEEEKEQCLFDDEEDD